MAIRVYTSASRVRLGGSPGKLPPSPESSLTRLEATSGPSCAQPPPPPADFRPVLPTFLIGSQSNFRRAVPLEICKLHHCMCADIGAALLLRPSGGPATDAQKLTDSMRLRSARLPRRDRKKCKPNCGSTRRNGQASGACACQMGLCTKYLAVGARVPCVHTYACVQTNRHVHVHDRAHGGATSQEDQKTSPESKGTPKNMAGAGLRELGFGQESGTGSAQMN